MRLVKSKKNKNKPKLNLTVRQEQRNKLEQMASSENLSVSNLIEGRRALIAFTHSSASRKVCS